MYSRFTDLHFEYTWTITKVCRLRQENDEAIFSKIFKRHKVEWQLEFYPNGQDPSSKDYTSLFLTLVNARAQFEVNVRYQIQVAHGKGFS